MQAHYEQGSEQDRLDSPFGVIEFTRTQEIVLRALPPAPAVIADIGGGPGRYALWLAGMGHAVEHRDIAQGHVQLLSELAPDGVRSRWGDARTLDLGEESVDAVLLLGPLYHLTARDERVTALRQAARIVKPGGPVFAAAISRWAPRLHGLVAQRLYEDYPQMHDAVAEVERDGVLPPLYEGAFTGYTHRPHELREEVMEAGLTLVDLVAVEGIAFALSDLEDRVRSKPALDVVLDAARAVERAPEMLGLGPHLLATALRPS
jgi:SAM-dependent methyltransferase